MQKAVAIRHFRSQYVKIRKYKVYKTEKTEFIK